MTGFYRFFQPPVTFLTRVWTRMRRIRRENIPSEGGIVLVCNHLAFWDMVSVASMTKRYICFVAKSELEKNWFTRFVMEQVKAIGVDRGKPDLGAIRKMMAVIKQGDILMIFPEGTRNKNPETTPLLPLQEGTALVALRTGAPVIPMWIEGHYNPIQGVTVRVGEPVDLDAFRQERKPDLSLATKCIEDALLALRQEALKG